EFSTLNRPFQDRKPNPKQIKPARQPGERSGLVEMMGGSFVGMRMGSHDTREPRYLGTRGAAILVCDPGFTVRPDPFSQITERSLT
ncbi:hypothetical protein, partial [Antrihabitans spumae]